MNVMKRILVIFVFLFLFFIVLTIAVELENDLIGEKEYAKGSHGSVVSVVDIRDDVVLLNVVGGSFLIEEGEIHSMKGNNIYKGTIEVLKVSSDKVLLRQEIEKTYKHYILMSAMSAALTFIITYLIVRLAVWSFRFSKVIEEKLSK